MSHASLAARYRPQTFAEVTGQETVKAILSRAAAEDKVAPAYLLSGTRGVGKTTIARIFAKALNCVHAPTGEPCNQCEQCRRITMGNHVDVVEIDGASNRGIDDARRLREAIAYAPDGEKDNPKFLDLVNQFLVCMFAESDNMIFRVLLRSSRELAHVTYYIVAYTLDTQELCKTYRTVLDGLTSGHASEAIDYWCGWSDRVTVQYREALLQLGSE
mgnify:CR=1 FL=1